MNNTYDVVPDIISCKDLDYLSDMFQWNYGGYKSLINSLELIKDPEIKSMLEKVAQTLYGNMQAVLNILEVKNEHQ